MRKSFLVPIYVECTACSEVALTRGRMTTTPSWNGAMGETNVAVEWPGDWMRWGWRAQLETLGLCPRHFEEWVREQSDPDFKAIVELGWEPRRMAKRAASRGWRTVPGETWDEVLAAVRDAVASDPTTGFTAVHSSRHRL